MLDGAGGGTAGGGTKLAHGSAGRFHGSAARVWVDLSGEGARDLADLSRKISKGGDSAALATSAARLLAALRCGFATAASSDSVGRSGYQGSGEKSGSNVGALVPVGPPACMTQMAYTAELVWWESQEVDVECGVRDVVVRGVVAGSSFLGYDSAKGGVVGVDVKAEGGVAGSC